MKETIILKMLHAFAAVSAGCVLACAANADRLITIPTAPSLGIAQTKMEVLHADSRGGETRYWANVGLPMGLEISVDGESTEVHSDMGFGLQYTVLPDTGFTPAIGIGVTDLTSRTDAGSGLYLAASFQLPYLPENQLVNSIKLFAGLGEGRYAGAFFGTEMGLTNNLTLRAEYDSRDFNTALDWRAVNGVSVTIANLNDQLNYGFRVQIGL